VSSLTQDIANRCQAVLRLSKQQGGLLHEFRTLDVSSNPGRFREIMIELQSLQCGLQAECNSIKVALAAEAMTGGLPMVATVPVDELELHPVNWPAPGHGRVLALDRLVEPEGLREEIRQSRSAPQHAPSADEIEAMERSLRRAGDDTELVNHEDHRHVSMIQEGGEG